MTSTPATAIVHAPTWTPVPGEEAKKLVTKLNLDQSSKDRLMAESIRVLSRCKDPQSQSENEIGLVVGYVQSGKTMSFTTVAALARDAEFRMIIAITGISNYLFNQSVERLEKDLQINDRDDRPWLRINNPGQAINDADTISNALKDWRDPALVDSANKQTIFITVMKNHSHLGKLLATLDGLDLSDVPTLIIDDEADQAGMNRLVNDNEESTIYRRLTALRTILPNHSYLQYTATPQAPLLVNIIDAISPNFAEVLTPGDAYVGGLAFFVEKPQQLVREIPAGELPGSGNFTLEPPPSLIFAMKVFLLGVAAGVLEHGGTRGNRSMMVHPSQITDDHGTYYGWVDGLIKEWKTAFELPADDLDRIDAMQGFEEAYKELKTTATGLPAQDKVFERLPQALRKTKLELLNSTPDASRNIDWHSSYGFILVGGQAMDRGFTVEGLTVSYMPRSIGGGNADTIQQRARFFGYRRSYLEFCRVYLGRASINAFTAYVRHEEDIRKQLMEFSGQSLDAWKRAFFLANALQPTRRNVLNFDFIRGNFAKDWYWPNSPHESARAMAHNNQVADAFMASLTFTTDSQYGIHDVATGLRLSTVYEQVLTDLRATSTTDSQKHTGLLLQIKAYLDSGNDPECDVYFMFKGQERERTAHGGVLPGLFQGAYDIAGGTRYPGDSHVRSQTKAVVQIHQLDIKEGMTVYPKVKLVAVRLPRSMEAPWLAQQVT